MRPALLRRVLGVAALAVAVLLFVLWRSLADDAPAAPKVTRAPTEAVEVEPPPAPPVDTVRPRAGPPITVLRRPTTTTPDRALPAAPELEPAPPPDAARKPPPPFWRELNDQVMDTETWVKECNERAIAGGAKLSGEAAYSFVVARKGKKVTVTRTGTEYSSIENPSISECMRDASKRMTFETLPDGVASMIAYRKVVLKDGVLTENWLTEFRPLETTPPAPGG